MKRYEKFKPVAVNIMLSNTVMPSCKLKAGEPKESMAKVHSISNTKGRYFQLI